MFEPEHDPDADDREEYEPKGSQADKNGGSRQPNLAHRQKDVVDHDEQ